VVLLFLARTYPPTIKAIADVIIAYLQRQDAIVVIEQRGVSDKVLHGGNRSVEERRELKCLVLNLLGASFDDDGEDG
jgi:hypothetical protein